MKFRLQRVDVDTVLRHIITFTLRLLYPRYSFVPAWTRWWKENSQFLPAMQSTPLATDSKVKVTSADTSLRVRITRPKKQPAYYELNCSHFDPFLVIWHPYWHVSKLTDTCHCHHFHQFSLQRSRRSPLTRIKAASVEEGIGMKQRKQMEMLPLLETFFGWFAPTLNTNFVTLQPLHKDKIWHFNPRHNKERIDGVRVQLPLPVSSSARVSTNMGREKKARVPVPRRTEIDSVCWALFQKTIFFSAGANNHCIILPTS